MAGVAVDTGVAAGFIAAGVAGVAALALGAIAAAGVGVGEGVLAEEVGSAGSGGNVGIKSGSGPSNGSPRIGFASALEAPRDDATGLVDDVVLTDGSAGTDAGEKTGAEGSVACARAPGVVAEGGPNGDGVIASDSLRLSGKGRAGCRVVVEEVPVVTLPFDWSPLADSSTADTVGARPVGSVGTGLTPGCGAVATTELTPVVAAAEVAVRPMARESTAAVGLGMAPIGAPAVDCVGPWARLVPTADVPVPAGLPGTGA